MIVNMFCGIGDELGFTPFVREIRKLFRDEIISIKNSRHDVWANNPHLVGGSKDSGLNLSVNRSGPWRGATLSEMFANQFGIGLVDNVPEIYLTPAELATPFGIEDWGRTVTIDTWSAAPRRRWPHAKYAQLVEAMARGGWRVIEVGKNEAPPIQSWKSFKNTMSLRQTAALIGKCSLHIGNDSGLAHIAAAMGTPQVTLFGIVPPENRAYWSTVGIWKPKLCHRECLGHERCLVLREVRAWDEYAPPLESFCAIPIDDVMEAVDVAVRRHGIK